MPYITQEQRESLDDHIDALLQELSNLKNPAQLDGRLNYIISQLVSNGMLNIEGRWTYHYIARAIAVFEAAKMEFYRRVATPYEDAKMKEYGDLPVYEGSNGMVR
jgi:hypothetical protein